MADDRFAMDERAFQLWGMPWAEAVNFADLSAHIHPADRDRVQAAFTATRSVPGPYEIDFRIMVGADIRWISARGQAAELEEPDAPMFGIFLDVTGRKQAEEGSELLAGEMSHRVKNLLAIAAGLTQITSRSVSSVEEMTGQLTQRLISLGRAHDLVRPLPGEQGKAALLGDLMAILLSPYEDTGAFSGRIRVAVPRMGVGESTATTLAMVVHELATNSVRHGALSASAGTLDVSGRTEEGEVHITWAETGGPEVCFQPEMTGFGSQMIQRSVVSQLAGSLSYDWQPSGLVATLVMRKDRMGR
ncbi:sensor histidine kinase [Sphingomonas glaciei]|uniref:histidine kinase n=1 Tax=Sphingomonas glaciei TaxID=2938948 RepID=A0ABY5MZC0_9SPHN|nr:HWE histidine kinase domain-containing protein [Sphingomonas glaciei]UUR09374.1 PAS domain-containing protein [Sphingomonas glaciei]